MYCSACGQQVPDDAVFCSRCGRRVRSVPQRSVQRVVETESDLSGPPPLEKPWSQGYFLFLIVMTVVAPIVGLVGGPYVMAKGGPKREQGQILLALGGAVAFLYLLFMASTGEL